MMGTSHVLMAMIAGCGAAAAAGQAGAPVTVQLTMVAVTGGAGLLPDIDAKGSTVSRSLWFVTGALSWLAVASSRLVFEATKTKRDRGSGGHRHLWHTVPGCLTFGALAGFVSVTSQVGAVLTIGVMIALLGEAYRPLAGTLGVAVTVTAPALVGDCSRWWWCWALAVAVGALAHVAGDGCTVSGVPIRWPMLVDGRRWHMSRIARPMSTGNPAEKLLAALVFTPAVFVGLALVSGLVAVSLWPPAIALLPAVG